jgi:hypothetical protein
MSSAATATEAKHTAQHIQFIFIIVCPNVANQARCKASRELAWGAGFMITVSSTL